MNKKIIMSAFAKAAMETPGNTKTQWADHLADVLWLDYKYQVSRRTLLNYYNYYQNCNLEHEISPKVQTLRLLCQYLGYPDYEAFISIQMNLGAVDAKKSHKIMYTLENEDYQEKVTILIQREPRNALNVA